MAYSWATRMAWEALIVALMTVGGQQIFDAISWRDDYYDSSGELDLNHPPDWLLAGCEWPWGKLDNEL